MSENLITLSRNEANVLQTFVSQVDYWLSVYGDKAKHLEILYFPEDDGFDVINGEENNGILKRNRITAFRADLLSWGTQQVKALKGLLDLRVFIKTIDLVLLANYKTVIQLYKQINQQNHSI